MSCNGDVHDASAIMGQHHKDEQGGRSRSGRRRSRALRAVSCDSSRRCARSATVACTGGLCNSRPWPDRHRSRFSAARRGFEAQPTGGFAFDIVRISVRTSAGTDGRPTRRRLFHVHNSRKPPRCHAMTVSGLTSTSALRHSCQTRESQPRADGRPGKAGADTGATAPGLGVGDVTRATRAEVRHVIVRYFEALGRARREPTSSRSSVCSSDRNIQRMNKNEFQ
jgi:hypothetical protein